MSAVASIDFLSSIPSEVLQASGRFGQVYDLQLSLGRAQQHLEWVRENLYEQIDRDERAAHARGLMGSLTPAYERVERDADVIAARTRVEELTEQVATAQSEVGGIVFLPAVDNVAEITKRLVALNRKAAKLGTEPITLTVTDEKLVLNYRSDEESTRGADFAHVFAVLAGTIPKVEGFEFLAAITTTESGNVVKRIPAIRYGIAHNIEFGHTREEERFSPAAKALDAIDLTRFHHTGDACEHCHKDRARKDCYVVYNETTGEALQVGRTCLRDYMGTNNPEQVVKVLEQVWEFMRSLGGSRGQREAVSTFSFLTHCAAVMRVEGGYKRGLGHDGATNLDNFINERKDKRTGEKLYVEPTAADEGAAVVIQSWVRTAWDEESEFATNVKISLADDFMNPKLYGYAGAAFIAYDKWLGREQERKAKAEKPVSDHIGTIKERITMTLTVNAIKWIDGYMPGTTKPLILMEDENGNSVKWFASDLPIVADIDSEPTIGGVYQVKATIKAHEDSDRFGKATQITRAKFEKTISEPKEGDE